MQKTENLFCNKNQPAILPAVRYGIYIAGGDEVFEKGLEFCIERDPHYKCAQCNPHFTD